MVVGQICILRGRRINLQRRPMSMPRSLPAGQLMQPPAKRIQDIYTCWCVSIYTYTYICSIYIYMITIYNTTCMGTSIHCILHICKHGGSIDIQYNTCIYIYMLTYVAFYVWIYTHVSRYLYTPIRYNMMYAHILHNIYNIYVVYNMYTHDM